MIDLVIGFAIIMIAFCCLVLVFLLSKEIEKQGESQPGKLQPADSRRLQQIIFQLRRDYPDRDENWYWHKAQRELIERQTQAPPVSFPSSTPVKTPARSTPSASPSLVEQRTARQLFALTNGDRKLANRLLEKTREYHPARSEQWVWEKVIYDIERDRRA